MISIEACGHSSMKERVDIIRQSLLNTEKICMMPNKRKNRVMRKVEKHNIIYREKNICLIISKKKKMQTKLMHKLFGNVCAEVIGNEKL